MTGRREFWKLFFIFFVEITFTQTALCGLYLEYAGQERYAEGQNGRVEKTFNKSGNSEPAACVRQRRRGLAGSEALGGVSGAYRFSCVRRAEGRSSLQICAHMPVPGGAFGLSLPSPVRGPSRPGAQAWNMGKDA